MAKFICKFANCQLTLALPSVPRQDRNVHDYLADLDSEVPLYMKVV